MAKVTPIIVAHGGAGNVTTERAIEKNEGMIIALTAGYEAMVKALNDKQDREGRCSVAASVAVKVVEAMENLEAFNAGYGSVVNENGHVEMDACLMDGRDLRYGGVVCLGGFKHPISIAKAVLEKSSACLLAGIGAKRFALANGFEEVSEDDLISPNVRLSYEEWKQAGGGLVTTKEVKGAEGSSGTVGAVVIDMNGDLAAATSTGGLLGNAEGRIGDSPICGMGTYACNEVGAVSTTGTGESLMKFLAAKEIADIISQRPDDLNQGIMEVLNKMTSKVGGDGGAILLTPTGSVGIEFNSLRMSWGYLRVEADNGNPPILNYGCSRGEKLQHELLE